nr:nuclear pore complex protein Nup160 homolog [Cherax quadricarinatus]
MSGQQLGFREVLPHQSALVQWRNITVDTGAAQSTLQDIKVPEYGGGYAFKPLSPATRNRYLFWRVCHDVVELWEESLDYDFTHNHVQLRYSIGPIPACAVLSLSYHVQLTLDITVLDLSDFSSSG